jgi:vancomycin resistance protein VanJ
MRQSLSLMSRVAGASLRALIGAYGLSIAGLLALRLVISEQDSLLMALFNSLIHLMVLPALILLPAGLVARRWGLALMVLPGAIAALLWYAPFYLPRTDAGLTSSGAIPITVMTWNIASWSGRFDEKIALMIESGAAVIALQEVNPDLAASSAAALAEAYPYQALHPDPATVRGTALFSRHPIVEDEYFTTRNGIQRSVIEVGQQRVVIYNVHVAYPLSRTGFNARREEVDWLLRMADSETAPVLLLGDFNLTDRSDPYKTITAQFEDAFAVAGTGPGFTFAAGYVPGIGVPLPGWIGPLMRIDYIFYDSAFEITRAIVAGDSLGADHHAVTAALWLLE